MKILKNLTNLLLGMESGRVKKHHQYILKQKKLNMAVFKEEMLTYSEME
jgi:hypothetical protein